MKEKDCQVFSLQDFKAAICETESLRLRKEAQLLKLIFPGFDAKMPFSGKHDLISCPGEEQCRQH
jgi:hypothetical protein